ncbi:MAG: purine-nucleoside phosphorylase [Halobacteriovorax sp.]|nr:purine-nucleoside phosphorylase [Halobacteriovorax sp.]
MTLFEKLEEASAYIKKQRDVRPQVGVILGSGLGAFVDQIQDKVTLAYDDIPHFKQTTVEGHEGRLILGKIGNVEVAVMQGRYHAYEGHHTDQVVFPVRLLARLGIDSIILTNASGGVNESYKAGDLVMITDHINLSGQNPLVGPNIAELGPRFPDMTKAYDPKLQEILMSQAKTQGVDLKKGVYAGVLGPTYETPAEVRMIRILGGDLVGMSTVPESIAANHLGLSVAGVSCVTNMAAGIENVKLQHSDIKEQALKVMQKFSSLLVESIKIIGNPQ